MVCPVRRLGAAFGVTLARTIVTWPRRQCVVVFGSDGRPLWVPCYHPLQAWPGGPDQPRVVFDPRQSYSGSVAFELPCGRCIGCRVAKARDWATRMHHEAKLHQDNSFVTLTYDDDHLPADGSLSKHAVQAFLKRLRHRVAGDLGNRDQVAGVRYFAVGEYGEQLFRPHYHLILFGFFPGDAKVWRKVRDNYTYRSSVMDALWPFGHVETGRVSPKSCGYVARYALKKVSGERAEEFYRRPHPVTGQVYQVIPEFALMSRRPGLGSGWFDRFHADAFPSDFLIVDGKKRNVPAYYKKKLSELQQLQVTQRRKMEARKPQALADKTPERLATRERSQALRLQALKRNVE